jgi:hypothetical protein
MGGAFRKINSLRCDLPTKGNTNETENSRNQDIQGGGEPSSFQQQIPGL